MWKPAVCGTFIALAADGALLTSAAPALPVHGAATVGVVVPRGLPSPVPTATPSERPALQAVSPKPTCQPVADDSKRPLPRECDTWFSVVGPFLHTQTKPAPAATPTSGPFLAEFEGSYAFSDALRAHASALDRGSGAFGSANDNLSAAAIPSAAKIPTWFPCALCRPATGLQQPLVKQAPLQPPLGFALPAQANAFASIVDLNRMLPLNYGADFTIDTAAAQQPEHESLAFGMARGIATDGSSFDNDFGVWQSPIGSDEARRDFLLGLVFARTNTIAAPTADTPRAQLVRSWDGLFTAVYQPNPGRLPAPSFISVFQYGAHDAPGIAQGSAETIGILQNVVYQQTTQPNRWDFAVKGTPNDFAASAAYVARGPKFTPQAVQSDTLVGLHGYAGDATFYLRAPFRRTRPMTLETSAYAFADGLPRYANVAGTLAVPLSDNFAFTAKASHGVISTGPASTSFGATPIADEQGGALLVPQSNVEGDLSYAGQYGLTQLGVQGGFANSVQANCDLTGKLTAPCFPTHRKQLTFSTYVDGPQGFLFFQVGPATLGGKSGSVPTDAQAQAPLGFGNFINTASWTLEGGLHLPHLMRGSCNALVVYANNNQSPPDVAASVPGAIVSVTGYLETVPASADGRIAIFAGASHTLSNTATPVFGMPTTLASQLSSVVTYELKVALGHPQRGIASYLQRRCTTQKPQS